MPSAATTLFLLLLASVLFYVLSTFLRLLFRQARSPLHFLRGPPSPSFFMGNLREMHDMENTRLVARWERQYGSTFVYHGFIGGCRLMTTDPLAVAHIMGRAYDYPKPDFVRDNLASMAAGSEGLLTVEGEDHRRQRKILSPAFTAPQIKSLSHIFWAKAVQLRGIWLDILAAPQAQNALSDPLHTVSPTDPFTTSTGGPSEDDSAMRAAASTTSFLPNPFSAFVPSKSSRHRSDRRPPPCDDATAPAPRPLTGRSSRPRIDVLAWLARATLDAIGEAGFGYHFHSLSAAAGSSSADESESELARAFGVIFGAARKFRVVTILQAWFPVLLRFRGNSATMREAQETMRRIGLALIEERQAAILGQQSVAVGQTRSKAESSGAIEGDKTFEDRDLLSVLIRSNLSSVPSQRLSLSETLCQISTFIAAGHETSSSALSWTLYALARAPDIQTTLRTHLRAIPLDAFSSRPPSPLPLPLPWDLLDDILCCPYLDCVVREALRLHAPITSTMRVAGVDDVIPVSAPFRDRRGRVRVAIDVKKGDIITIPIQAMNKGREVWGEDAEEFRPGRWVGGEGREDDEEGGQGSGTGTGVGTGQMKAGAPGLWGGMLTFGNGNPVKGNRACIGYRFAINEIKIFLFVLVRDIEFSIDPEIEIEKKVNVVTRPWVKSEPHMGNQMPLYLRHVPPEAQ